MRRMKTEHSGAKNGGGHRGKREEAKRQSKKQRRLVDRIETLDTSHNEGESCAE